MSTKLENTEFADNLKRLLNKKEMRQSDLAKATGLGRDSISNYFNGKTIPNPENLLRLSDALGCTPEDLLPPSLVVNHPPILKIERVSDGLMRVRILQDVTADQALAIIKILNKE
jgi:transcriptional regulator with XRE-family HTH domain